MTASKKETGSASTSFTPMTFPDAPALSRLALYNASSGTYTALTGAISISSSQNLYVLTHGWAAGYAQDVVNYYNSNKQMLTVWETLDYPTQGSTPAGPWIFLPTTASIPVSTTGMCATICAFDPNAVVLVYSWLDAAATPSPTLTTGYANFSNAAANLYGIVAAGAIMQAIKGSTPHGIHLLGHSDGAKVMTVAAAELANNGIQVAHLSIFDSPENESAHSGNSANYVWYFLSGLTTTRKPMGSTGTFVDNYVSCFDVDLSIFQYSPPSGGTVNLGAVVDTNLASTVLYGTGLSSLSERHGYAPAWYGGASEQSTPQYGLTWSPLINPGAAPDLSQMYQQTWTQPTPGTQFVLASQTPPAGKTPLFSSLQFNNTTLTIPNGQTSTSVSFQIDVSIGTADGFSFTYSVDPPSGNAPDPVLTATINGTFLFTMVGNWSQGKTRTGTLNAGSLVGGKGTLEFMLTGAAGASASIGNFYSFSGAI